MLDPNSQNHPSSQQGVLLDGEIPDTQIIMVSGKTTDEQHRQTSANNGVNGVNAPANSPLNHLEELSKVNSPEPDPQSSHDRRANERNTTLVALVQNQEREILERGVEILNMSAKWKEEVDKLYERRMKLERSQKKLLAENKDLKLAQQQRENAGRDPLERYLFDQRRLVYAAEQRISRMEEIVQFAPRDVSQKRSLDWKRKVDDYMDGIGAELDSVLHSHDTSIRLLTPEIPIESDLGSLMTCAFGMGNWEQSLKSCDLKFGARAVVKSLVLAALQIWVFLTAFPNFNPKDMQKIEAIWEAVLDQGNWDGLRTLDLVVQQRLVDNPRFQDSLLPREATRLGACLCRALAPLFHAHSNGAEIVNAETGGNNDIWEDMRYRLTGIFETALRLKVVTVMAECIGEFVIYPLSTSHIRESMAATLSQNSSSSDDQLPSSENGLWKHASIKLYAREASQPRDLSADALVLTMNFVSQMKEKCRTCLHSKDIILPEALEIADLDVGFEPQSPEAGSISQNFVSQFPTVPDVPFHKVIGPSIESLQETSQHAANVDTNSRLKISNAQSHTEEAGNRVPIERPQTERRRIVPEIIGNDATISFGEGQSPPDRLASISELSSTTQSPQYSTTCRICRRGFKSLENLRLHSKKSRSCIAPCDEPGCGMRFTRAQDAIDHAKRRHNRMPTQVIRKPPQNLSAGSSNDGRTRIGQDESRSMESLKRQNAVRMKPPHSKPQIQFQCNRCHREFSTNSHLRKHQRENCPTCLLCEEIFTNCHFLKKHLLEGRCNGQSPSRLVSESSPKKPPIAQTPATTGLAGSDEESSVAGATAEAVIHVDDNMRTGVQRAKRYGKGNNPSKHPSRQYGLLGDQENNEMDSGVAAPVESSPGNKALKSRHRSRKRTSISKPTYPCPICKIEYPTGYYRDKHYRNKHDKVVRCPTCPKEFRQLSSQIKHRNSECKKTTSTEIETKGLEITGDSSSFEPGGFLIQTGAAQFLDKQPEKPQFPNNSKGSSRSEQKQSQSSGMDTGHAILAGPLDGWHRTARQPMATPSTSPRLGQGDTGGEVGVMDKSNHSENREKDMSQREDEFLLSDGEQTEVNNDAAAAQTGKSDAATVDQPRIPAESNSSGMTGSEHGNQETILVPNSSNQVSEDAHATRIRASAGSLAGVDASSNGSVADAQGSDDPMQEERPAKRVRWMTGWAMAQSANGNTYFQREVLNMNTTRNSEAANSSRSVPRQQHESSGSPNVAVNNVLKCILWKR